MSSNINLSTVTFDGKEVMSLREAFYQAVFQNPTIDQFHTVVNGIKAKQQMLYLGQFGLMGKKFTACEPTASTAAILPIEKFWEPQYVGDRIPSVIPIF
ncbi:hypothetical protein KXQ82_09060 [Mucilaginibacter sp. HMF5004]|uniref:hypothetical protein n=1 Tax=Mucilaginibacter rivuli TaxID=2857527 RepID=UPI001C5F955A|nr:hypothetical protein [Mucilaginibacter rivuli]MBW4889864.1 hypothetical protein [Mucilaginibacter rivuli]